MFNPVKWIKDYLEVKAVKKEIKRTRELQAEAMAMPFIDVINKGDRVGLLIVLQGVMMVYQYNFKVQTVREDGTVVFKPLQDMEDKI